MKTLTLILMLITLLNAKEFESWESQVVYYEDRECGWKDGHLKYIFDEFCNRIPDFSYAGYHLGIKNLPSPPIKIILHPINGDNAPQIQEAIDSIEAPGVILLQPGACYDLFQTIHLNKNGVIIRGVIDKKDDKNCTKTTIIRICGEERRSALLAGSAKFQSPLNEMEEAEIKEHIVPLGSLLFEIDRPELFKEGDSVMIKTVSSHPLYFPRKIQKITTINQTTTLQLDAPLFQHLTSQSSIYFWQREALYEIGIENLKIKIEDPLIDHAISFIGIENSWVNNVFLEGFTGSAIYTSNASKISCKSIFTYSDRGNPEIEEQLNHFFADEGSDLILVQRMQSEDANRAFLIDGSGSTSGIVFLDCSIINAAKKSGTLFGLSAGLLFDHIDFSFPNSENGSIALDLCQSTHSVAWGIKIPTNELNLNAKKVSQRLAIQKIETDQNYAIGTIGHLSGKNKEDLSDCYIENKPLGNYFLEPTSLYEAQLFERKRYRALLGD